MRIRKFSVWSFIDGIHEGRVVCMEDEIEAAIARAEKEFDTNTNCVKVAVWNEHTKSVEAVFHTGKRD